MPKKSIIRTGKPISNANSKSSAKFIPIRCEIARDDMGVTFAGERCALTISPEGNSERERESGKLGKHPLRFNDRVEVSR